MQNEQELFVKHYHRLDKKLSQVRHFFITPMIIYFERLQTPVWTKKNSSLVVSKLKQTSFHLTKSTSWEKDLPLLNEDQFLTPHHFTKRVPSGCSSIVTFTVSSGNSSSTSSGHSMKQRPRP